MIFLKCFRYFQLLESCLLTHLEAPDATVCQVSGHGDYSRVDIQGEELGAKSTCYHGIGDRMLEKTCKH